MDKDKIAALEDAHAKAKYWVENTSSYDCSIVFGTPKERNAFYEAARAHLEQLRRGV